MAAMREANGTRLRRGGLGHPVRYLAIRRRALAIDSAAQGSLAKRSVGGVARERMEAETITSPSCCTCTSSMLAKPRF